MAEKQKFDKNSRKSIEFYIQNSLKNSQVYGIWNIIYKNLTLGTVQLKEAILCLISFNINY